MSPKTKIDRGYLVSLNYVPIVEEGNVYLKKDYVGIPLFNQQNEIIDLVDISIYLVENGGRWIISKCLSFDSNNTDVFNTHFKSNEIRELLYFDKVNNK